MIMRRRRLPHRRPHRLSLRSPPDPFVAERLGSALSELVSTVLRLVFLTVTAGLFLPLLPIPGLLGLPLAGAFGLHDIIPWANFAISLPSLFWTPFAFLFTHAVEVEDSPILGLLTNDAFIFIRFIALLLMLLSFISNACRTVWKHHSHPLFLLILAFIAGPRQTTDFLALILGSVLSLPNLAATKAGFVT